MPAQFTVEWAVPNAGPAVSVFHTDGSGVADQVATALRAFFDSLKAQIPNDVTISFPGEFKQLDDATGTLSSVGTYTPPANVVGTAVGGWAGGAGARVDWATGDVVNGRRVRGRTFFVPLANSSFTASGTVSSSFLTLVQASAPTLISALAASGMRFVVWHRPTTVGGSDGSVHEVTHALYPTLAATLRGRKY